MSAIERDLLVCADPIKDRPLEPVQQKLLFDDVAPELDEAVGKLRETLAGFICGHDIFDRGGYPHQPSVSEKSSDGTVADRCPLRGPSIRVRFLHFLSTIIFMARWLIPRSGVGRLVIQLVVLAVVVGGVYLLVLVLGSGLRGSTLEVSGVRWG